ncbi:hypothetical protein LCGC14_1373630 [marine sediment metagenome]|uniref:Uncharacterized protein n=1 Tax=marine sediment metagenome TaxID=412755 RepID=A0A0F9K4P3_9ZZZZ
MEKTGKEAIREVNKFLEKTNRCKTCGRKHGDITFSNVPKPTLKEFTEWCKEELSNNFGMGLKWLWDFKTGILGEGHERAEAIAIEALERIEKIERELAKPTEEESSIKNVAGQEMKVK